MSRLLLFGRDGQLGRALAPQLVSIGTVISLGHREVDLGNPAAIRQAIQTHAPDWIINAAAYTAVDRAESEREVAWAINAVAPGVMAVAAAEAGIPLLHYSTDYVFDGRKPAAYRETDPPGPLNVYGRSKLAGEEAIQASGAQHLILRGSWLYGRTGSNFLMTILAAAAQREQLQVVDDQIGAPTPHVELARVTAALLGQIQAQPELLAAHGGVYHAACSSAVSWFGFAQAIVSHAKQQAPGQRWASVAPIRTSEIARPAVRPANSRLDCQRLAAVFNLRLPDWQKALADCMDGIKLPAGDGPAAS